LNGPHTENIIMPHEIRRVAVVGSGTIGASWAALFLARGLEVVATDPVPGARSKLEAFIAAAWPALEQIGLAPGASQARLAFTDDVDAAVAGSDFVQENAPERLDVKQDLYKRLDAKLPPHVIIASSSSGLMMTAIQPACDRHPERCVIAHPFNPPHLVPLVEIVGGEKTSEETIERASAFYEGLGKHTIRLRKEMPGHVANRLQAALWREAVHLVAEGVVSVADADAAVAYGPGLRWGIMGPNLLFHLGGGEGGIEHFLAQFTGPMTSWWHTLGTPELTPEVRAALVAGIREEVSSRSVPELAAYRDKILLGLLALRRDDA
jgi:3-hydroxyacyl-CoA dehydrogenase